MYASPVMIVNAAGIHARPASELVNYCKQFFNTSIYIITYTLLMVKSGSMQKASSVFSVAV